MDIIIPSTLLIIKSSNPENSTSHEEAWWKYFNQLKAMGLYTCKMYRA